MPQPNDTVVAEWTAPPPTEPLRGARPGELLLFVDELRARPGTWARYHVPYTTASNVYANRKRHPGTEWRPVRRKDGRYDVYGRWIGVAA